MKCFPLAVRFDERLVTSNWVSVRRSRFCINYGSLANIAPASDLRFIAVIANFKPYGNFVRHDCQEVEGQVFLHGFFLESRSTLVVIQTIILGYSECLRFMNASPSPYILFIR